MPRRKNYGPPTGASESKSSSDATSAQRGVVEFFDVLGPEGRVVAGHRVDLREWLGKGLDEWVDACITTMRVVLHARLVQTTTLEARRAGLKSFFRFLLEARPEDRVHRPRDLTVSHIRSFTSWLKARHARKELAWKSARCYYFAVRGTLADLYNYGFIDSDPAEFFRDNAFRGQPVNESQSTKPLSNLEQIALGKALKRDLVDSRHGRVALRPSELATVMLLIVGLRTGESLVPLLELSRKAPAEGVLPGTLVLNTIRRRGHKVVGRRLRQPAETQGDGDSVNSPPRVISTDAAAILKLMIAETESLVPHAPARYRDRIWLYRKTRGAGAGEVTALTQSSVQKAVSAIVARHDLRDDEGNRLRLGIRRTRASYGIRAFEASGGSVEITADLLGNTIKVAGSNYVPITEAVKAEGVAFMDSLPSRLSERLKDKLKPTYASGGNQLTITPVAACRDSISGEFAPNDANNICDSWVMCLFCKDCAITGDDEGLWRLFSFRDFAERELERLVRRHGVQPTGDERSDMLKELYRLAVPFIGEFASAHFKHSAVYRAERRARQAPSPFWIYQEELALSRR